MKPVLPGLALLAVLFAAGCGDDDAADAPPPVALTQDAIGHFCGMSLVEHPGPKGQILLRGNDKPVWFSSARDAIAFTYLGEEAKAIRAIYVSDMGRAESWKCRAPPTGWTRGGRISCSAVTAAAAWERRRRCPFRMRRPPRASSPRMAAGCWPSPKCRAIGCWVMTARRPWRRSHRPRRWPRRPHRRSMRIRRR